MGRTGLVLLALAFTGAAASEANPVAAVSPIGRAVVARAPGPLVQTMIVGRRTVLFPARSVSAGAGVVSARGRRCRIGAGSPLAALLAARRAGGPAFALHDYASCSRAARDAGGLFVSRVGPDTNRGRDGWVYKVDGRLGTTAAADPSGPFGNGQRLRTGQKLLWFWCTLTGAGACQQTLELAAASVTATRGADVRVQVNADDDRGRRTPIAGATVVLGKSVSTSDAAGHVSVTAPATPGHYLVTASAGGLVAPFPVSIDVR